MNKNCLDNEYDTLVTLLQADCETLEELIDLIESRINGIEIEIERKNKINE